MTTEEKEEINTAIDAAFEDDSSGALTKLRIQLKRIVAGIPESSSGVSGTFIIQGNFDSRPGAFPTAEDCIDSDAGIKKGFAWRSAHSSAIASTYVKEGEYIVANKDDAGQDMTDWDIQQGNIIEGNLIATATDVNGNSAGTTELDSYQGRNIENHFVTHIVIKIKTGTWGGSGQLLGNSAPIADDLALLPPSENMNLVFTPNNVGRHTGGALVYEVTDPRGGTLTFDVFVYGIEY